MEKKVNPTVDNRVPKIPQGEINLGKKELEQLIFDLVEVPVNEKLTDQYIDRENEKIELIDGRRIPNLTNKDLEKLILEHASEYRKRFPQSFYDEIYRLNKWQLPKNKTFRKYIVGRYTNEIIYMRFTKDGLLKLQGLNPYGQMYKRSFKHFQFLSDEGKLMLDQIIFEATECMKECDTWYEFRLKYGQKYKLNVQLRMFEEESGEVLN